ncbi:RHS repeat-associated protein [Prolixibacter denitrificans]|uniref:RHS repeat-associated protein n=2 Tax=Prolixibacter denitrificans TaxID=1541063 RepID=A0A2P8C7L4_9BACT|nr:RHS repeat-associated protein [Prolixibacter denitrificans]
MNFHWLNRKPEHLQSTELSIKQLRSRFWKRVFRDSFILLGLLVIVFVVTSIRSGDPTSQNVNQPVDSVKVARPVPLGDVLSPDSLALPDEVGSVNYPATRKEGFIGVFANRPVDNPVDNVFHVHIDHPVQKNATVWLEYDLKGVQDYTGISHSVNEQLSVGGYFVRKNKTWGRQKELLNPGDLKEGDNVIRFTLPEGAGYGYQIRNLSIKVEPYRELQERSQRKLVVNQPVNECYYGKLGYLEGYVTGSGSKQASVYVAGDKVRFQNGTFESIVQKPENSEKTWSVNVRAVFPDGEELLTRVLFRQPAKWDTKNGFHKEIHLAEKTAEPGKGFALKLGDALLKGDAGSVKENTRLSVTALRARDVPALDPGMVNVTSGFSGYRFLPHGTRFQKPVTMELGYDTHKIPNGYSEEDIRTCYFDEETNHWVPLHRDSVLLALNAVRSGTTHFTDFINAIIKVPESPQTQGYTPTSMKDVKVANPATGINLIAPPTANSMGNANLSYPIAVPAGRQGMQPSLSLRYNSGGGDGWLGLGWDLSVPSISVDTRWGVPRYDPNLESETYTMQGEQLSPVAYRSAWKPRDKSVDAEKLFYPRVEGAFSEIKRHGGSPATYWWEVTDKSGVKYYYGGDGSNVDQNAVLKDYKGNIAFWALTKVQDVFGNCVTYQYDIDEIRQSAGDKYPSKQIYLKEINYTGYGHEKGAYSVYFKRTKLVNGEERKDKSFDARLAFKRHTIDLLKTIEVKFNNSLIRSYELNYKEGAFFKTLLTSVDELDSQGKVFSEHEFDYYNDVTKGNQTKYFNSEVPWDSQGDDIQVDLYGLNKLPKFSPASSALSGSSSWSGGAGLYVGPGIGANPWSKKGTVGGSYSFNHSESDGKVLLVDLNGDGLPDKLFQKGGHVWFRPQLRQTAGDMEPHFGGAVPIESISRFLKEKTNSHSLGAQINISLSGFIGANTTYSKSKTSVYFSDVNGDGLPDLVDNGRVLFNRLKDGVPEFDGTSAGTPNPINQSGGIDSDIYKPDPTELQEAEKQNPLHDVIRVWQAPFTGKIDITAPIHLIEDFSAERKGYSTADGVVASLEYNGTRLWTDTITENDYSIKTLSIKSLDIKRGDRLFFRLNSRYDGAYDQVAWNPAITYINASNPDLKDANGKYYFRFIAGDDFVLTGNQTISTPIDGKIQLEGTIRKPVTSDNIKVSIIKEFDGAKDTIWSKHLSWKDSVSVDISQERTVKKGETYSFKVESQSNINWSNIHWKPRMYYTESDDENVQSVVDAEGEPTINAYATPSFSIYANTIRVSSPWVAPQAAKVDLIPGISFTNGYNGKVVFTAKRRNELIDKRTLTIADGVMSSKDTIQIEVNKGDSVFFGYYLPDFAKDGAINSNSFILQDSIKSFSDTLMASCYSPIADEDEIYGPLYGGWGQFIYNANDGRDSKVIDQQLLKLNDNIADVSKSDFDQIDDPSKLKGSKVYDPSTDIFILMTPDAEKGAWVGYDDLTYVKDTVVSSSRMGEDAISPFNPFSGGTGARAIDKMSRSLNISFSGGGKVGSGSVTTGWNRVLTDFTDMNGDRYPDVVTKDKIQYTNPDGSLSDFEKNFDALNKTTVYAAGPSMNGKFTETSKTPSHSANGNFYIVKSKGSTFNVGGGTGNNYTTQTYADINGDGLPDKIRLNGKVDINLGYSYTDDETWNIDSISGGHSNDINGGTGFSLWNNSFEGGIGLSTSFSHLRYSFIDVNGDGLVDLVYKKTGVVYLRLNTGTGFSQPFAWNEISDIGKSSTTSASANVSFTFGFSAFLAKIVFTPSINGSVGINRTNIQISDIDGDGYPDFLQSDVDSDIKVKSSAIARTNLLHTIHRPLKSSIELNYKPVGNTTDMPQSIWALSEVKVFDGHKGDGVDTLKTTFDYSDGYRDRRERTFYGFGEVKTHQLDEQGDVYRTTIQKFANDNYYDKGLLLSETLEDVKGRKYVETVNKYQLKDPADNLKAIADTADMATVYRAFPALVETHKYFYEGESSPQKSTYMSFGYGAYGNVVSYTDHGEPDEPGDSISSSIQYWELTGKHILNVPKSITVTGEGKTYRERSTEVDDQTGKITQITQALKKGQAVYDLHYDAYGNLDSIIQPANYKGQRMHYAYEYDHTVHSYITKVRDAYGYSSSSTYDYRFGQVLSTTDINGQETKYAIDDVGRITTITGPYELEAGVPFTIKFQYHPDATVPWAFTQHYDPDHPDNPIETAMFIDGLGRALQTKKDAAIFQSKHSDDEEMMIVSGKVTYDAFGRSVTSYYPVTEKKGHTETFNTSVDDIKPTKVAYDVLDRTVKTTLPDGAETTTKYGFGNDRDGKLRFMTQVTDANGKISESYTDVRNRKTAVKAPGKVWTSFVYDPLGELLQATDAEGNTTTSVYDMLGRRTSRNHPDAGLTDYTYDPAGNMLTQVTANLRGKNEAINYDYDYTRLTHITYPENTVNNVRYEYGKPGADFNRAGRITVQEDGTGAQEFFYGPLGEVVKNIRTIIVPDEGIYTFDTEWTYDTWNRLKHMVYPDGETLTYDYNKGGSLHEMYGEKNGHRYNYLTRLGYDKFEDRVYLAYGNGTETTYAYEPKRRRLHNITALTSAGRKMMDDTYTYDNVNNITRLQSTAPIPSADLKGGRFDYHYHYDDLYRLTNADGHYEGATHEHTYTLAMAYSPTGRILSKNQFHQFRGYDDTDWAPRHKTTYNWEYKYEGAQPHAPSQIGDRVYHYDANGNPTGWESTKNNNRREILWDEENRMRALADNGVAYHYMYDASGDRVIKASGDGQAVYVNGFPMGGSGTVGSYTMYVNPYMVVSNMKYTKHFYVEGQRIVSQLGEMGAYQDLLNPKDTVKAGHGIDWEKKKEHQKEQLIANFEALGLDGAVFTAGKSGKIPYGRIKKYFRENSTLVSTGTSASSSTSTDTKVENLQFYYHPDHLGSSSYITDASGEVYQHDEYFPFGETFVEERTDAEYTSYLFNGKELDQETGLYYYGARYYDPRISMWYGVDPMADKYPGVSPFDYCLNNPILLIDPNGNDPNDVLSKAFSYIGTLYEYGGKNPNVSAVGMADRTNSLFLVHMRNDITEPIFNAISSGNYEKVNEIYKSYGYGDIIGKSSIGIDCSGLAGQAFNSDPDKLMKNFNLAKQGATGMAIAFESEGKNGVFANGLLHNDFNLVGKGDLIFSNVSAGKNGNIINVKHTMIATGMVRRDRNGNVTKFQVVAASFSAGKVKKQWWTVNSNMRIGHTFRTTDNYNVGPLLDAKDRLKMSDFVSKYQY